jgi:4-hydroxybenzoate polyprenyltransferase
VIGRLLAFIRFSHTIFALPFALGSMFVAARGWPEPRIGLLILAAMVTARTAAMAFNRLADWKMDQLNPRTSGRHLLVSRTAAIGLLAASSAAFVASTYFINRICFALSPVALAIVFFYSVTKRFTSFTHLFLGLALAVAPAGAWLAVRGRLDPPPLILALAVLFWVAGFDLIYALLDADFDRAAGLNSLVVRLGARKSLALAQWFHLAMWLLLAGFGFTAGLGILYYGGLALVFGALVYEHLTARGMDVAAINKAFFQSNAFVGLVFVATVFADTCLK